LVYSCICLYDRPNDYALRELTTSGVAIGATFRF
jgi:hypothetical protein